MTDLKTTAGKIEDLDAKLTESRAPQGEVCLLYTSDAADE